MSREEKITHNEVQALFADYIAAVLAAPERARVEQHLAHCTICQQALTEARRIHALLHTLAEPAPPVSIADRVLARLGEPSALPEDLLASLLRDTDEEEDEGDVDFAEPPVSGHELRPLFPFTDVSGIEGAGSGKANNPGNGMYRPYVVKNPDEEKKSSKGEKPMLAIEAMYPRKSTGIMRPLTILAAIIIIALMVGSLLAALRLSQRNLNPSPTHPGTGVPNVAATATEESRATQSGIYVASWSTLFKLAPDGKTVIWHKDVQNLDETIAVSGNTVYAFARTGASVTVYTFSTKDGKSGWSAPIPTATIFSLLATDSMVYANGNDGTVYALSARDGHQVWAYPSGVRESGMTAAIHTMSLVNNVLYGTVANTFYAINAQSGQKVWQHDNIGGAGSLTQLQAPIVANGRVYAVGSDPSTQKTAVYSFYAADGAAGCPSEIFDTNIVGEFLLAVAQGKVFAVGASNVYVIDGKNCATLTTIPVNQPSRTSLPVVIGNTVYVLEENATQEATFDIAAINASTNSLLWRSAIFAGTPGDFKTAAGKLYVYTADNSVANGVKTALYAINASGQKIWSTPLAPTITAGGSGHDLVII